jgi:microsomal dipeptidase-like Zn-dependent dipeptidase
VIRGYDDAGNVIERGFSDDNIEKIPRENCMRIFEELL